MSGKSPAAPAALSPEARLARGLNLCAAGALAILCLVALGIALERVPHAPHDYGEGRGWGILIFVVTIPFVALFWLAAEGFRRRARWRWIAQLAALSPLWLAGIFSLINALRDLR